MKTQREFFERALLEQQEKTEMAAEKAKSAAEKARAAAEKAQAADETAKTTSQKIEQVEKRLPKGKTTEASGNNISSALVEPENDAVRGLQNEALQLLSDHETQMRQMRDKLASLEESHDRLMREKELLLTNNKKAPKAKTPHKDALDHKSCEPSRTDPGSSKPLKLADLV